MHMWPSILNGTVVNIDHKVDIPDKGEYTYKELKEKGCIDLIEGITLFLSIKKKGIDCCCQNKTKKKMNIRRHLLVEKSFVDKLEEIRKAIEELSSESQEKLVLLLLWLKALSYCKTLPYCEYVPFVNLFEFFNLDEGLRTELANIKVKFQDIQNIHIKYEDVFYSDKFDELNYIEGAMAYTFRSGNKGFDVLFLWPIYHHNDPQKRGKMRMYVEIKGFNKGLLARRSKEMGVTKALLSLYDGDCNDQVERKQEEEEEEKSIAQDFKNNQDKYLLEFNDIKKNAMKNWMDTSDYWKNPMPTASNIKIYTMERQKLELMIQVETMKRDSGCTSNEFDRDLYAGAPLLPNDSSKVLQLKNLIPKGLSTFLWNLVDESTQREQTQGNVIYTKLKNAKKRELKNDTSLNEGIQTYVELKVSESPDTDPEESKDDARKYIEHCLNEGNDIVIIFGKEGAGKTLLCRMLQNDNLDHYKQNDNQYIPVYSLMSKYTNFSKDIFIADLEKQLSPKLRSELSPTTKFRWYVDGLDVSAIANIIECLDLDNLHVQVIITCQSDGIDIQQTLLRCNPQRSISVLYILSLSKTQRDVYISNYANNIDKSCEEKQCIEIIEKNSNLQILAKQPLLLYILLKQLPTWLRKKKPLDKISKARLIKAYHKMNTEPDQQHDYNLLAFKMFINNTSVHMIEKKKSKAQSKKSVLDAAARNLKYIGDNCFTFSHKWTRDWCVAEHIANDIFDEFAKRLSHIIVRGKGDIHKNTKIAIANVARIFLSRLILGGSPQTYDRTFPIICVQFSLDGSYFLTCENASIQKCDVATGKCNLWRDGNTMEVARLSPCGSKIAWCPRGERIEIVDVASDKSIWTFEMEEAEAKTWVNDLQFSEDGEIIAVALNNGIEVYDLKSKEKRWEKKGKSIAGCHFSPDGSTLALCSNNIIQIRDAKNRKVINILKGHSDIVKGVQFSPKGSRVVSCSKDKTIRIWSVKKGKEIKRLEGHSDVVNKVRFSPDGSKLVSCSNDKTIRLWDVKSGTQIHQFNDHTSAVNDICWFSDGSKMLPNICHLFFCQCYGKRAKVDNVQDGKSFWYLLTKIIETKFRNATLIVLVDSFEFKQSTYIALFVSSFL
ncbi:hypothetical protein RFI_01983 [Reticulomyxa filosa]|uniref:Uncharacterized protein n=1 Tax=Reticulomyxa filosa TaxID=46433 RepID=X6P980_RETFI|nr:hypothetical protein RFI_01983 [Reticulomyxa filosa]|eukprot:ETO35090.1 hypothetical protein RFI_01983 [Reticulomyxa filosa]